MKTRMAIFASGSGSNAEKIFQYFSDNEYIEVGLVLTNNKNAFVIERAKKFKIPYIVFNRENFYKSDEVIDILQKENISWIVLAGFLWLVPNNLLKAFPNKIINIHPALLPRFGGRGMYGMNVHQAVIEAKEKETGITIHYIDEHYDQGNIIFQIKCEICEGDTPEIIAQKVQQLEHKHFPKVIEDIVKK